MTLPGPPPALGRWSIGTVSSPRVSHVEADGRVVVHRADGPLGVRWAVATGERDHRPETAPSLRRRRLGGVPVVETAVRVGHDDVRCRAYGARAPGDVVVVELENATPAPLLLELVLERPDLRWHAADRVVTDRRGAVVVVLSIAPGDVRAAPEGTVLALPFVHGTTVRLLAPADGSSRFAPPPSAEQVGAGWRRQIDAGARVVLPDPGWQEGVTVALAEALLARGGPSALARPLGVLDRWGHAGVVREVLVDAVRVQRSDGSFGDGGEADTTAVLERLAAHVGLTGDAALAGAVAEAVTGAVQWSCGRRVSGVTRLGVAAAAAVLLRSAGHDAAADAVLHSTGDVAVEDTGDTAGVVATGAGTDELWQWVDAVHRFLASADRGDLVLLDPWPAAWDGRDVEVHELPTTAGLVSYALRWHGARPALLWEVTPVTSGRGGTADPVRIVVPGLAGGWSTRHPSGETMLR